MEKTKIIVQVEIFGCFLLSWLQSICESMRNTIFSSLYLIESYCMYYIFTAFPSTVSCDFINHNCSYRNSEPSAVQWSHVSKGLYKLIIIMHCCCIYIVVVVVVVLLLLCAPPPPPNVQFKLLERLLFSAL